MKKIGYVSIAKLALALCLVLLAGCGSIPTMVPDMEMQSSHPVQLEGAQGPLTTKQSKAILERHRRIYHIGEQRTPGDPVQHLRQRRVHAFALACGEYDDVKWHSGSGSGF